MCQDSQYTLILLGACLEDLEDEEETKDGDPKEDAQDEEEEGAEESDADESIDLEGEQKHTSFQDCTSTLDSDCTSPLGRQIPFALLLNIQ